MDLLHAAQGLAALGHEARLELFRLLVQAGQGGVRVSDLQQALDKPASTVAFHLRALVDAGLVLQQRQGREVLCVADYTALRTLLDFVREDCCRGLPGTPPA